MIDDARKAEVRGVWARYGDAITKAFHFPKGSRILTEDLEAIIGGMSDDSARRFIAFTERQIEDLRTMKFVGEPD